MNGNSDPMTFDDLTSAYRVEAKSSVLTAVRRDLYGELAKLKETLKKEYERELSNDPTSIICEGINERRKKANTLVQKIVDNRMEKVAVMAIRASMGADNSVENLTPEERIYYDAAVTVSKKHRSALLGDNKGYTIPDIASAAEGRPADTEEKKKDAARTVADTEEKKKSAALPAAEGAGKRTDAVHSETDGGKKRDPVLPAADGGDKKKDASLPAKAGGKKKEKKQKAADDGQDDMIVVRILEDLPKIAGPDCDYELKKEDVVRMPAALANALINHEKATLLNVTP